MDAVVASLRRKLGGRSEAIETVRGFGYIYRAEHGAARLRQRLTSLLTRFSCSDHAASGGRH